MSANKIRQIYFIISASILVIFAAIGLIRVDNKPIRQMNSFMIEIHPATKQTKSLEYRVWKVLPAGKGGYVLALVSVDPKHFNREDMFELGTRLNKEFSQENFFKAVLFDDDTIPRNFGSVSIEIPTFNAAQKGLYYIDRKRCKEYIQFYVRKKKRKSSVTIKFHCLNQNKSKS